MKSISSIAAALFASAVLTASAASADPFTVEYGCVAENDFCKFTVPMRDNSSEIRFVSCTVFTKDEATSVYRVQLTVAGSRTQIPLSWQRLNEHGPRKIYTFNQQLLLFHRGAKSPEFFISATGPFQADCTVSMV